jgi:hypothetical protein
VECPCLAPGHVCKYSMPWSCGGAFIPPRPQRPSIRHDS